MNFTIKDLKVINQGALLASFNVEFSSPARLTFNGMTLLTGKNGVFCNYPSVPYKDEHGQTKYQWKAFFADEAVSRDFKQRVALAAHEEYKALSAPKEQAEPKYQPQQVMPF